MIVLNQSKNSMVADNCVLASSFFKRFKGLMGIRSFEHGQGLLITPCNSIHMFFMKIPLDIIFLNKNNTVIHIIENIKPWSVSNIIHNASSVLELPEGTIKGTKTDLNDVLAFKSN